jgi:[acyl-carrier-protein] S-malonyltransferase
LKKIAFLFPGQGSQKVGMGKDLFDAHDEAKNVFAAADEITGLPISHMCFEGPMETLTQTVNLQPAVTAMNLACLAILKKMSVAPCMCAGHSLGEYSALCAADSITVVDCLKLVFKRGRLMHREAERHQGAMSAIVGLTIDQVDGIVARTAHKGVVAVANHNSAEQIVITGSPDAVRAAAEAAEAAGARAIALKVSGAWHSPLIQGAEAEFKAFIEAMPFMPPKCPVIHNATADTAPDPQQIQALMTRQLCSPVRWYDTMLKLAQAGTEVFVEIGPGKVLTGLLKKILPEGYGARIYNVNDLKTIDKFLSSES